MTNTKQSKPLAVKQIKIADIKPAKYNPRTMDDKSFEALVAAIRDYGQRENLIVNKNMTLISGHQRLRAMVRLGYKTAAADVVDLTGQDEKKLNLIMNSPLLQGKFDMLKVDDLLKELRLSDNMADYRLPELGKLELKPSAGKLSDRFVVAPFSVLNTTSGDWQKRKAAWSAKIGDKAESREGAQAYDRQASPGYMANAMEAAGGGTSILDPVLAEILCRWFGIPGGATFDPFAGDTVFGYVAGYLGLQFTGIELRKEQADLNQARVDADKLPAKYICDDALNMDNHIAAESQDFIFSCPPYADLEVYSDLPNDLSTMSHDDFFKVYQTVLTGLYGKLKNNRFCAITISEVRNKKGEYIGLVPKTIAFMQAAGFKYYNEVVLVNAVGTLRLRVKRQMKTRKVGRMHQNVLVFYKGDTAAIKSEYPELTELEGLDSGRDNL